MDSTDIWRRAALLLVALLALVWVTQAVAQDEVPPLRLYEGTSVIVPISEADARIVMLGTGAMLVCWRMTAAPGYQCRRMDTEGAACDWPGGRFACRIAPEPEDAPSTSPPAAPRIVPRASDLPA